MKFLVTLAMIAVLFSPAFAQEPAQQRMVLMISLDGFPAYSLDDPRLPIPTLRHLIENGVRARMTTVNPTITWPNHTTMVTGVRSDQHGLLANGTISRTGGWPPVKVDETIDKEKMVHAPTVYDAAYKAGLTTAQVNWVAINRAPTITWPFSEWPSPEGPVEREMIRKGIISATDLENFERSNILFRDQIWTTAAVHLIREHKPNLLLFHLLSLDSVHHEYGPGSLAALSAFAFLDACVARLLEAVNAAGMREHSTFIIVSDHGFKKYTKQIRPAVALAAASLAGEAYVLPEGGSAYVYFDQSKAAELTPKVVRALEGVEGIDKIIGPDGFAVLGLPQPDRDVQIGQLVLTAKDGYSFSGSTGGPVTAAIPQQAGSHGYLATDPDMDAIFIASGYGVRAGARVERIANVDVAPTVARLLGVSLPTASGRPIPIQ
ncbi:MAG TPA: alkaline phosphatase family protein [Bryobacteraceae bacterium]|nr:alkaline phosphatase family protein [Bryobacteraceae bacterium]HXR17217.1 alkaline phosphatase family protein [Terriglobales bacterium]HZW92676.1 alkaline phosphatase family protein [Candidatus Eremiobacteraceae bacterium]